MTESWVIKAIEKEAMSRAIEQLNRYPTTFRFMGYSPEQMTVIVMFALRKASINPSMTHEELDKALDI